MKPRCKNCGDTTTFATFGDKSPDYERQELGWCRRCWRLAMRQAKDKWPKLYRELLDQARKDRDTAPGSAATGNHNP